MGLFKNVPGGLAEQAVLDQMCLLDNKSVRAALWLVGRKGSNAAKNNCWSLEVAREKMSRHFMIGEHELPCCCSIFVLYSAVLCLDNLCPLLTNADYELKSAILFQIQAWLFVTPQRMKLPI